MTKVCNDCKQKLKDAIKEDAEKLGIDPDTYLDNFVKTLEEIMKKDA